MEDDTWPANDIWSDDEVWSDNDTQNEDITQDKDDTGDENDTQNEEDAGDENEISAEDDTQNEEDAGDENRTSTEEDPWNEGWSNPRRASEETQSISGASQPDEYPESESWSPPKEIVLSGIWKDLPMEIQAIVIDMLCIEAEYDLIWPHEYENMPVLWNHGTFSGRALTHTWNTLLAVGGYFSGEVLRRLIRWQGWTFEDLDTFSLALQSWEIVSPGSWNQIRYLCLEPIRWDGTNCEDVIAILSKVPKFTNLKALYLSFECREDHLGYIHHYFDENVDLDESYPELFLALEAVRVPNVNIRGLNNYNMINHLWAVMTGRKSPFNLENCKQLPWRRDHTTTLELWGW